MTVVTWKGLSGNWAFPSSWSTLTTPKAADSVVFTAADSSVATVSTSVAVTGVSLAAGSHATVLIQGTLAHSGLFSLAGGTLDLESGGVLSGGTVNLAGSAVVANGGVIDNAVLLGALGRGVTVTSTTIADTSTARSGAALAVSGTLVLADGTYSSVVLSLHPFQSSGASELDAADGGVAVIDTNARVSLSQDDPAHGTNVAPGSSVAPVLGGTGQFENLGLIVSDAVAATIAASGFFNLGSIDLIDSAAVAESQVFFNQILNWTQVFAPELTIANSQFENDGTITGQGATVDVVGGSLVNTGLIDLGHATTQGVVSSPTPHVGTLELSSTLDIAADAVFSNSGTIAADTIDFHGLVALTDLGSLAGTVLFTGTLDLGGGTLDSTTLAAGTTYVITGTVENGTIIDTDGRIDVSAATTSNVGVVFHQAVTLTDVAGPGSVILNGTTTELAYTSPATINGLSVVTGAVGVTDTISAGAASLTFGSTSTITDAVTGSTLAIIGGRFVDNGHISLVGSNLGVSTLDGTGTITLADNAVLTIDTLAATAHLTIAFGHGVNELILPGNATGLGTLGLTVTGLAGGDLIDFAGLAAVDPATGQTFGAPGAALSNGKINVTGGSGEHGSIATTGTGLTFTAINDQVGGTIISVACFRHGTRIATPDGDRPVETLAIGDHVLTRGGAARPIRWLGRRAYPRHLVARQPQLRPVRVARGALGMGLPRRTLVLSPLHALLVDGILVPVAALVNGRTITRAPIADVAYVHVELDSPDILIAEGTPSETFVDCDNRAMFDNAAEFDRLYPGDARRTWNFPVPRVEEGWRIEAIRARLGATTASSATGSLRGHVDSLSGASVSGWAMDETAPDDAVEFEMLAGGRQVGCLVANAYRIDLDRAGIGRAAHGFTAALPALSPAELSSFQLLRLSDGARLGM